MLAERSNWFDILYLVQQRSCRGSRSLRWPLHCRATQQKIQRAIHLRYDMVLPTIVYASHKSILDDWLWLEAPCVRAWEPSMAQNFGRRRQSRCSYLWNSEESLQRMGSSLNRAHRRWESFINLPWVANRIWCWLWQVVTWYRRIWVLN